MWHNIIRILYYRYVQMWEYKEMYNYEKYKGRSRVTKTNSRDEQEGWKVKIHLEGGEEVYG